MMRLSVLFGILFYCLAVAAGEIRLYNPPGEGEAYIWYLGHAGWMVRTSQHCLIFDATGPFEEGDLDRGSLSPEMLGGQPVILFISHAHGDHFDPGILELHDSVKESVLVLGWNPANKGDAVVPGDGRWTNVSGAQVFTLHHDFDSIPEGFFLVRSGGVTIFHSGDHGTTVDPPNNQFQANIDRMAAAADSVDIAFISSFGTRNSLSTLNTGDIYTITTLKPRVTIPMHCGGCENRYAAFASEASALGLQTTIGVADAPGWFFHFLGSTGQ